MNEKTIFDLPPLPARCDVRRTALILGFQEYEIPVLIRLKHLKPLGSPSQNGHKYFSTAELLELAKDREWLDKATRAVARHWQQRNQKNKRM